MVGGAGGVSKNVAHHGPPKKDWLNSPIAVPKKTKFELQAYKVFIFVEMLQRT